VDLLKIEHIVTKDVVSTRHEKVREDGVFTIGSFSLAMINRQVKCIS